jgi:ABC-2 type transport system permease protein
VTLHGVRAIARRDFLITRSYRLAFALDAFYGLLALAVYFFISKTFEGASVDLGGAPSYFAFAAVGVAVGLVLDAASGGVASRLREEQLTGTLEALACQPLRSIELAVGLVAFPFLFALARAVVYLGAAVIWSGLDVSDTSWTGLVVVLAVSGVALSPLGLIAGAVVLVLKRGVVIVSAVVFALILLSGAAFPVSVLPGWLEAVSAVLPLRFAFDGTRAALFEGTGWAADVVALALFGLVGIPLGLLSFAGALSFAKRRGSVAQY